MTASGPPGRERLLGTDLVGTPRVVRCETHRVVLAAGQAAGAHRHPCHVVGLVTSGRVRFELEGGEPVVLEPGDAFHEPRDTLVRHFDNDSPSQPATFVATYLLEGADQPLIVMEGSS